LKIDDLKDNLESYE
jgi:hypothetical protein